MTAPRRSLSIPEIPVEDLMLLLYPLHLLLLGVLALLPLIAFVRSKTVKGSKSVFRRPVILILGTIGIVGLIVNFFIIIPHYGCPREETHAKMIFNNLRLVDNAMDRVMLVSNFNSIAEIRKPMVDDLVDSLDIAAMKWPKGTQLVTSKGLVQIANDPLGMPDDPWNDFLTNDCENGYLAIVFDGETITTDKTVMDP